jgi:hypothetical protein
MKVNVRGYEFNVQAKQGRQLSFVLNQLKQRTDEQLASYERGDYPERFALRQAFAKITFAEEILRELLSDKIEAAEQELAKATFAVYDDYTEDEDGNSVGILYPENVDQDLDDLTFDLFEIGLRLGAML